ncbi:MAG: hypothetical protein M4579_005272, partial [Chaenotheca gracillima]
MVKLKDRTIWPDEIEHPADEPGEEPEFEYPKYPPEHRAAHEKRGSFYSTNSSRPGSHDAFPPPPDYVPESESHDYADGSRRSRRSRSSNRPQPPDSFYSAHTQFEYSTYQVEHVGRSPIYSNDGPSSGRNDAFQFYYGSEGESYDLEDPESRRRFRDRSTSRPQPPYSCHSARTQSECSTYPVKQEETMHFNCITVQKENLTTSRILRVEDVSVIDQPVAHNPQILIIQLAHN